MNLIFTVSELNQAVKTLLESTLGVVTVAGEISNVSTPVSGHTYFTLKDPRAQIRCAHFKQHRSSQFSLQNGMQILATGTLSLYEARGDYQLIVHTIVDSGIGILTQQFEALKKKLSQAGLFETAHKKPIPPFPQTIGLITSPGTAALRDLLITLHKRYPLAHVKLYPSEVQGKTAPLQLCQALQAACLENHAEVLIIARGGGSLEDLWAFNDEALAYAIFQATLPIITGIGHETDFTLADFVADHRAATPTAAAIAATPDQYALLQHLNRTRQQLTMQLALRLKRAEAQSQKVTHRFQRYTSTFSDLIQHIKTLEQTLIYRLQQRIYTTQQTLDLANRTLTALHPMQTLKRGFAIATQAGLVLTDTAQLNPHLPLQLTLAQGVITGQFVPEASPCSS